MSEDARRILNVVLLAVLAASGWFWFAAHIKPHIEQILFGTVSVAAVIGVAVTVWKAFVGDDETKNAIRAFLKKRSATWILLLAFVPVAIAFAVTGTIYVKAVEPVVFRITGQSAPISLDKAGEERAVTYTSLLQPITLTITADKPRGYKPKPMTLRRAIPLTFKVPDQLEKKTFHLIRLVPGDNFFSLRGSANPDPLYRLTITIPGKPAIPPQQGLKFQAIYLGAALDDLNEAAKRYRTADLGSLRDFIGSSTPADERDRIIGEWLDAPLLIATSELEGTEEVHVELAMGSVTKKWVIHPTRELTTKFIEGVPR